ncbi:MAG: hypothetical protein AB1467_03040 [Candidatus Diapherotrites archaeon]
MGFFGSGKKEEQKDEAGEQEGKYSETCSLCGGTGTDKKWAGKYWHKRCYRSARKASKKFI